MKLFPFLFDGIFFAFGEDLHVFHESFFRAVILIAHMAFFAVVGFAPCGGFILLFLCGLSVDVVLG